jgi:chromosome segregation ATPase
VAELERQIAEAETKRGELAQDQSRLRENLGAVPHDSDLARRYLDGLAASEDELTALASRFAATRTELESARAARAEFVRSLKV